MGKMVVALIVSVVLVGLTAIVPPGSITEPTRVDVGDTCAPTGSDPDALDLGEMLRSVSGGFTENLGQVTNWDVRFYARGHPLSVGLASTSVIFTLRDTTFMRPTDPFSEPRLRSESVSFRLDFVGCGASGPSAVGGVLHESDFYVGNDVDRWQLGVSSYPEVVYEGLYPGIDMRFYFRDGALKYDIIVGSGADASAVRMRYVGVDSTAIEATSGDMLISTGLGTVRDSRPIILQDIHGTASVMSASFKLFEDNTWGFELPDGLDVARPFTIDPGLQYCSYLGGTGLEWAPCIERSGDGGFFVSTIIYGDDFPNETGELGPAPEQLVLCKLDGTLQHILFSRFFGGTSIGFGAWLTEMHLRSDGSVVITGNIDNGTFPTTPNAIDRTYGEGGKDAFMIMLSATGSLLYSSFFGGNDWDSSITSFMDPSDNLILVLGTSSDDIPATAGAYCTTFSGEIDIVLAKLDSTLETLEFCTYIGTSGSESVYGCALDAEGNIVLSGGVDSKDFPWTTTPPTGMDVDVFVLKMKGDGSEILSCVGFGGEEWETTRVLKLSDNGTIYIAGFSSSTDLPVKNAIQSEYGGNGDWFVAAYDPSGTQLLFLSYLGGSMIDFHVFSAAWSASKDTLYIAGITESPDFPTTRGCYDETYDSWYDIVLAGINASTFGLDYSTYIEGSGDDYSLWESLELDGSGNIVLAGVGTSNDLRCTPDAIDKTFDGETEVYILRLDPRPVDPPAALTNLSVEGFGDGFVNVSWERDPSFEYTVTSYRLYRGAGPEMEEMGLLVGTGTNLSYNNTGLVNGREYFYRVTVVNSAGEGPPSEAVKGIPMALPGPPLDLQASTGNGTVTLRWAPPSDDGGRLIGYHVWRGSTDQCPDSIGTTSGQPFLDTEATPGSTYYYRVTAFNELGDGIRSEYERIKTIDVPSKPVNFTATGGLGAVVLRWEKPVMDGGSSLLGFVLHRGASATHLEYLDQLLPNQLMYTDGQVINGTTFFYTLTALSGAGLGRSSEMMSAMPYGPPTDVESITAVGDDGSILIEWEPPASDGGRSVTGYKLYAGPDGSSLTFLGLVGTGTSESHDIENGVTWHFAVAAVNEAGEGPRSEVVWATAMGPPSAPQALAVHKLPGAVVLTWSRPTNDGGSTSLAYRVLKGPSEAQLSVLVEVTDELSWTDTSVEVGGTYYYSIFAVNLVGVAGPRFEPTIVVQMADVPGQPLNLTPRAGNGLVRLSWSQPVDDGGSPILRYVILRGSATQDLKEVATVMGTRTEYIDLGLVNGQEYHFAVQAENDVGVGARSDTMPATPYPPPGKPGLKVELKDDKVVLTWTEPTGESTPLTGYIVYRGPNRDRLVIIAELGLILTFTDKDVEEGKVYYYSVSAVSESGEGERADPVKLEVKEGLPISNILIIILVVIIVALLVGLMRRGRLGTSKPTPPGTPDGS